MWPKKKQFNPKTLTRLHSLRLERGVSIEELSHRNGVEKGTIKRPEQGKHHPFLSTLYTITQALGVDLDPQIEARSNETTRPGWKEKTSDGNR